MAALAHAFLHLSAVRPPPSSQTWWVIFCDERSLKLERYSLHQRSAYRRPVSGTKPGREALLRHGTPLFAELLPGRAVENPEWFIFSPYEPKGSIFVHSLRNKLLSITAHPSLRIPDDATSGIEDEKFEDISCPSSARAPPPAPRSVFFLSLGSRKTCQFSTVLFLQHAQPDAAGREARRLHVVLLLPYAARQSQVRDAVAHGGGFVQRAV